MTVPPTRDELLELAELDALGALEPAEQARFERGLRDASPALRAEAQAIQDTVVLDPVGLIDEEPEAGLKYKVMARIADAVSESEAELAPIGSIGRSAPTRRPLPVVAPIAPIAPASAPMAPAAVQRDADVLQRVTQAAEHGELERLRTMLDRARAHGYMLRAACIALAASLIVFSYAFLRQSSYTQQVTLAAISESSREDLKALLGPTIEPFLRDGVPSGALAAVAPKAMGGVLLWIDPASGNGFLLAVGIDSTRGFDLVAIAPTSDAPAVVVATGLKSHGPLSGHLLEKVSFFKGWRYQLRDAATGDVIYEGPVK